MRSSLARTFFDCFVIGRPDLAGGPQLLRDRMTLPANAVKPWVYVFSAHALVDPEEARALIETYLEDPDPLLAEAARISLAM